ncbi:MAG: metallophosphoesterase [Acidobacteria bacterium]|nr:metallophosphoesterase [Acidobacteriota bacterium]
MSVVIFFGMFLLIMGLISFYIYIRGLQSIPKDASLRYPYIIVFWIIACSFIGGRLLERVWPSFLSDLFIWIGSFWIAAMIYFLIAVVSLDVLRIINHFFPFFPSAITKNYAQAKYFIGAAVMGLVGVILLAGHINSLIPRIRKLDLSIAKPAGAFKSLKIAMASDIHLGTIVGRSRFDHIVEKINSLDADLVLLPGDIVDEDLRPVIKQNLGESLRNIKARLGVYAATGNHEHIGGVEKACAYLTDHNIVVLRDESIKIGGSFYLVGREDRAVGRFDGYQRKSLPELLEDIDKKYPIILMDHQPFGLSEAAAEGVDLQLSGHTHYGQLWPVNYIVRRVYEVAWGYKKIGNTHFYVSNGVGTWGPPVRVGNRPEIVLLHLTFQ